MEISGMNTGVVFSRMGKRPKARHSKSECYGVIRPSGMSGSALSLNRSFLLKIDEQTKEMILPNGPLQSFSRLCVELRVVSEFLTSIPASAVEYRKH